MSNLPYTRCFAKLHNLRRYKTLDEVYTWLRIPLVCQTLQDFIVLEQHLDNLSKITDCMKRRLDVYLEVKPDGKVFDLSQNAKKRCRCATTCLPTLTKGCSYWWIRDHQRFFCTLSRITVSCQTKEPNSVFSVFYCGSHSTSLATQGGGELLLAHGFPVSSWAAEEMNMQRYEVSGLSILASL